MVISCPRTFNITQRYLTRLERPFVHIVIIAGNAERTVAKMELVTFEYRKAFMTFLLKQTFDIPGRVLAFLFGLAIAKALGWF